jgi:hypothetical protein
VLGNVVGTVPAGILVGGGWLALSGIRQLVVFSGSGAYSTTVVLTVLGAMPVLLLGAVAMVAIPAIVGAWATGTLARPKLGYALDPHWSMQDPPRLVPEQPAGRQPAIQPLLTVPLPG